MILLKHSFYNTLIDKANVEGGIFLMLDNSGSILAVSNKTGIELGDEVLSHISEETEMEDFQIQGKTALLYTLESSTGGYRIKTLIPYSQILDPSRDLQRYYWTLLAASVVLGLGAGRLSRPPQRNASESVDRAYPGQLRSGLFRHSGPGADQERCGHASRPAGVPLRRSLSSMKP